MLKVLPISHAHLKSAFKKQMSSKSDAVDSLKMKAFTIIIQKASIILKLVKSGEALSPYMTKVVLVLLVF